jgi:hypothetical protein
LGWHSLAIASPLFAFFGLGLCRRRLPPHYYWLLGLVAGSIGFVELLVIYALCTEKEAINQLIPFRSPPYWYVSLAMYPLAGAFLSFSGALLGARIRDKRHPDDISLDQKLGWQPTEWLKALAPFAGAIAAIISVIAQHFSGAAPKVGP